MKFLGPKFTLLPPTTSADTDYKWGCLWYCIPWYTDRCRADCRQQTEWDIAAVDSDMERSRHLVALQYTSAIIPREHTCRTINYDVQGDPIKQGPNV